MEAVIDFLGTWRWWGVGVGVGVGLDGCEKGKDGGEEGWGGGGRKVEVGGLNNRVYDTVFKIEEHCKLFS